MHALVYVPLQFLILFCWLLLLGLLLQLPRLLGLLELQVVWAWHCAFQQCPSFTYFAPSQFDFRYLYGRSLVLVDDDTGEPRVDLSRLGRLTAGGGALQERELNSGAYGNNKFCTLATPGVLQLDLLQVFRKEHKLDSYSLNNVSKNFLGDAKIDLPAWQIFDRFDGTAADRAVIAEYAAKDTVLPLQLLAKLCTLENLMEMANATFCPMNYVIQRGQQVPASTRGPGRTKGRPPPSSPTPSHPRRSRCTRCS